MSEAPVNDDKPLVEIRDLSVRFARQQVLRGINLTIPRGQTLVIIGESGCGKTVLLKSIIGLIQPTEGQVLFDGHDLSKLSSRELSKLRVQYGFLFQGAALFDSMTNYENVAFPLREHTRKSKTEIDAIVRQLINDVGLNETMLLKRPAELSGGMREARRLGQSTDSKAGPDAV